MRAQDILSGEVLAAYEELRAWLEQDMVFAADQAQGVWALPDGENYYNQRLARMTTLDLSADEIHRIGLREVDRLLSEMESVKQQTGFQGTLQEFLSSSGKMSNSTSPIPTRVDRIPQSQQ